MTSTTKETFEAFARTNRLSLDRLVNDERYTSMETEWAWRSYLAGLAAAAPPAAWLATDLDGRGDVAFTQEEAQRRAGEGCNHIAPLYAAPPAASAPAPLCVLTVDGNTGDWCESRNGEGTRVYDEESLVAAGLLRQ